ncbi:DNA-processing protein DprA [Variovorax sp. PCZ-1]|uniref:DNA-processing protein DprA n=1 Tax=Variovorax sp. PCZ-1 TaxID=2835533 RepID=UPI001BCFDB0C|nr:DNA-processing protein DprA [Variovorax sp. PCZ-1]MBS7806449.1 DNA-processing protein DprA [Variovorax sp. PCZ-1]
MTREELAQWLRLSAADGIGSLTATKLLQRFGLPEQIFSQSADTLSAGITAKQVKALLDPGQELPALIEATWNWLSDTSAAWRTVVSLADSDYPKALLQLPDPPILLYVTGSHAVYAHLAAKETADDIAIVGSRNATPQGLANARNFAKAFAQSGMHVVSGLALGIDGAAHEGALDAQQDFGSAAGSTVAVVGTGLDRVYPKRHHELAHRIVQHGLIVSEFPIGTPPLAENFPRRNRIIAALTQGTLVVEAAIQSGSLITARQALDLGKEVFAIPGSIHNPQSKGCHHLIKQGAKLVESAQDVLEELPIQPTAQLANTMISGALCADPMPANGIKGLENTQNNPLFEAMGHDPISLDSLIDRTGIPAAQLQVQLLELELLGDVARLPGGLFQRMAQA